jgi:hypothetical protein
VAGRARLVTGRAAGHCTVGTEHAVTLTLQLDPFLGAGHSFQATTQEDPSVEGARVLKQVMAEFLAGGFKDDAPAEPAPAAAPKPADDDDEPLF